jgi:hypothetical protein
MLLNTDARVNDEPVFEADCLFDIDGANPAGLDL